MVNNRARLRGRSLLLLFILFLAGCAAPAPSVNEPAATFTPLVQPTATATDIPITELLGIPASGTAQTVTPGGPATPMPTATSPTFLNLAPTQTARATGPTGTPFPTLAPEATRTPMPVGSATGYGWGLLPTASGLWAIRPDGSRATLLTNDAILHMAVSPGRTMLAYITHAEPVPTGYEAPYGYQLKLLTLSDDKIYTITTIDNLGAGPHSPSDSLDNAAQTIAAYKNGGMAWSPDGSSLAYVSGQGGKSADVFLYTPSAARIVRLTSLENLAGPPPGADKNSPYAAHAYALDWSLDGQRIFFAAAYQFGASGSSVMAGAWAVSRDGSQLLQVAGQDYNGENLVAWVGSANLLLSSFRPDCGDQNLRVVNVSSGQARVLWKGCYADLRYDRYPQTVLVSVTDAQAGPDNAPGLYYGSVNRGLKQISNHGYEKLYSGDTYAVPWYGFNAAEGLFALNRQGQANPLFTGQGYANTPNRLRPMMRWPNPRTWLFTADDGLYIARPGQPLALLFNQKPDMFALSPAQDRLFFSVSQEGQSQLYAMRSYDLKPVAVDNRINSPGAIVWP